MKPWLHAKLSAKKWGGKPEDYIKLHDFFDWSKSAFPDMRHRAILHHSFGIFLLEKVFGHNILNSDNKEVSVRDVGEQHVIDDMGFIPTVDHFLKHMSLGDFLSKKPSVKKFISLD